MLSKEKAFCQLILPKVSRTFAINISILKNIDYDTICNAYLICRILDTVEDDPKLKAEKKVKELNAFAKLWEKSKKPAEFQMWAKKIGIAPVIKEEKILIDHTKDILSIFFSLPKKNQKAMHEPIAEMAKGMATFTQRYSKKRIKCLESIKELEEYCYYVAGTVGKLLTAFFCLKVQNKKQRKELKKYYLHFSMGLQLVNILKDCWRDKKRSWLYIPKEIITKHKLTIKQFYNKENPKKCQDVYKELINMTEKHLEKALLYIENLPLKLYRYRLFCLLPLAIAIKTLQLLKKQTINKEKNIQDKISKKMVKWIIFQSFIFAISNKTLRFFYHKIILAKK